MTDLDEDATRRVLDRASACDPDAWEFLYRRGRLRLFRYARQRLIDDATTEDAIVETVIRAIRAITDLTGPATGFDLWTAVTLHDHVLPNLRRRRATAESLQGQAVEYIDLEPTVTEGESRGENVRQAFNALDPDVRDVLDLSVLARLDADEIAQVTASTPDAVGETRARALEHIRYMLDDESLHDDAILGALADVRVVAIPDLDPARVDALRALALAHRSSADERIPVRI